MDNTYIEQAIEHYKYNTNCYHINTLIILPVPNDIDLFIIVDVSSGTFRNVTYDLDKKKRLEKLESIKNKLRTTSTTLPIITEVYNSGSDSEYDSRSDSSYEEVVDESRIEELNPEYTQEEVKTEPTQYESGVIEKVNHDDSYQVEEVHNEE